MQGASDPRLQALECLEKTAETMRLLSRKANDKATGGSSSGGDIRDGAYRNDVSLLLLTGATMRQAAQQLLGLRPWAFRPQHSHKLGAAAWSRAPTALTDCIVNALHEGSHLVC